MELNMFYFHYENRVDFLIDKNHMSVIKEKKNVKGIFSQINHGKSCFFTFTSEDLPEILWYLYSF